MTSADSTPESGSPPVSPGQIFSDNVRFHLARLADAAREAALLHPAEDDDPEPAGRDLQTGNRLAEIRRRIAEGFYNRDEVRRKIADKLDDEITSL